MSWMNQYEIDDGCARWAHHPTLGPACRTLVNLVAVVNANSDGWPYWPKPGRAAKRLMDLITGDGTIRFYDADRQDVSADQVRMAYRPIKAFLTRNHLACTIEEPNA